MIRPRRSAHLSVRSPRFAALHQARMIGHLYSVVTRVCPHPMLIRRAFPERVPLHVSVAHAPQHADVDDEHTLAVHTRCRRRPALPW